MIKTKIQCKWLVIVSTVFIIFIIFVLPQMTKYSNEVIGKFDSPDTSLIYSGSDLYNMAENYGESGRKAYITLRWTFDLIWPFVYTLFLLLWTFKLLEYNLNKKWLRYVFILPVVSMGFDFMENIGSTIVMARYPLESGIIATLTPVITFIKWLTVLGSVLVLVYLIIKIVVSKIKKARAS